MASDLETYLASDLTEADVPTLVTMVQRLALVADNHDDQCACWRELLNDIDRLAREAMEASGG